MIIDSLKYNGMCSCGKEHKVVTEFCVIKSGCLKDIQKYIKKYNLDGFSVTVYDENTYKATLGSHPDTDCEIVLPAENLHANEHGVELLMKKLPEQTEILIAVDSGTIHDIVRYCAYNKNIVFVSCPTAASVDGFCSSVAAMTWHGCKKTLTAVAPKIVVADTDIIKNAPYRLTKSGLGDMLGKYIALADWKIGNILTNEYYCPRIAQLTLDATQSVLNSVDGILKKEEKAFENLMYGLLLSGISMQMIGNSRPASGAEHHISHMIEMEPKGLNIHSDALHGEKVGVGTLLALEEYQRLINLSNISFSDYSGFDEQSVIKIFDKEKLKDISDENRNDTAKGITAKTLTAHWTKICEVIKNLPDAKQLRKIYVKANIKSVLSDIGVKDNMAEELLNYSPMVRNRLTLMRLRKCITEEKI